MCEKLCAVCCNEISEIEHCETCHVDVCDICFFDFDCNSKDLIDSDGDYLMIAV